MEPTGTCYEDAATALIEGPRFSGWVLVHGRPTLTRPPFVRYGHAWLECGGMVYDAATRTLLPRPLYYGAGQITDEERYTYTREEARRMLLDHEHWGPWEGVEYEPPDEVGVASNSGR